MRRVERQIPLHDIVSPVETCISFCGCQMTDGKQNVQSVLNDLKSIYFSTVIFKAEKFNMMVYELCGLATFKLVH